MKFTRDNFPLTILGNNGSGKSSLLLAITGVIPEYIYAKVNNLSCTIKINNKELDLLNNKNLFRLIPQQINYGLLGFTPMDEINITKAKNSEWKEELIEHFEINNINKIPSSYLSDGEKKRLVICTALVSGVPLIFSDEWTTHLDEYWIAKINNIFNKYFRMGGFHLSFISSRLHLSADLGYNFFHFSSNVETFKIDSYRSKFNNYDYLDIIDKIIANNALHNIKLSARIKYGFKKGNDILLKAESGELISIIGPNGCGKTTLLKNLWKKSNHIIRRFYFSKIIHEELSRILLIPTNPIYHLLGPTIKDEFKMINVADSNNDNTCTILCDRLGLDGNYDVLSLSFGQRKVLSIILALISSKQIIAIDEPFSGLDENYTEIINNAFKIALKNGKILIVTSQRDEIDYATKKINFYN